MCLYPFFHSKEGLREERDYACIITLCGGTDGERDRSMKGERGYERRTESLHSVKSLYVEKMVRWT